MDSLNSPMKPTVSFFSLAKLFPDPTRFLTKQAETLVEGLIGLSDALSFDFVINKYEDAKALMSLSKPRSIPVTEKRKTYIAFRRHPEHGLCVSVHYTRNIENLTVTLNKPDLALGELITIAEVNDSYPCINHILTKLDVQYLMMLFGFTTIVFGELDARDLSLKIIDHIRSTL